MARLVLVTGGGRSGKSRYAQNLAESAGGSRAFVATCPQVDGEMAARIVRHQQARQGRGWHTIEAPIELEAVLRHRVEFQVLLIDCLTLWVNNLVFEAERRGRQLEEEDVETRCAALLEAGRQRQGTVIAVTNEVGMGIVPENPLARRFRDLVGRGNQVMAAAADEVVFMVSGIPLKVK